MAKNVVPEAKEALNRFKMEAANEVGVNLKQGYNGDLTSKQAGSIGGQMVKKMIESEISCSKLQLNKMAPTYNNVGAFSKKEYILIKTHSNYYYKTLKR